MSHTRPAAVDTATAARLAVLASVALVVAGVIQFLDTPSGETTVVGIEHVSLAAFTAVLVLLSPVVHVLGRWLGRPRVAAIAVTGQLLLAALTVVSNVRGDDPWFFPHVAVPANLLIVVGWIVLAVAMRRRARVPRWTAIGLPLSWIMTLMLAPMGGPLLAAAYWWLLGRRLRTVPLPLGQVDAAGEPAVQESA